jgi:hypothetical protein
MIMKYLLLILLTYSNYSFGQEPQVALQLVEINELYRGFKNRIAAGVTNNGEVD